MKKLEGVDEPLNVQERYMHGMVIRLDALCHMVSSLVDYLASKENVAVEVNTVVEESVSVDPVRTKRKKKEQVK
jgi:hypothetical protein